MPEPAITTRCVDAYPPLLHTLIEHRTSLIKAAARITGCYSRAEDVVQDAYLRVCNLSADALPGGALLNYVFRIVRNLAIDHYRKQSIEQKYIVHDEQDLGSALQLASPESINADRQTLDHLDEALLQLPSRTRYAFVMYRLHGKQQKDIAAELGVSPTLVNFMVRDALVHCRQSVLRAALH